ncbi:MAG TPA: bifunctional phosphopantothenoylcysteine decarboxylase/phosphopantothenate--cysteine ligase CoaBC [Candidatus Hydrogenedentes bacterium]|nr:bifunctional phosphopantothenoylcysteine decarboxylase/phosphopantothenate--cysteine ligase CoaBC [Candidatus Hydrogenedentota bacterium]HNT87065.1 bifunctional phosphopantothenoylcysteine decarboxylase/phosphopantothenate--cysteine ligase CoaBC [Candidatus Hydrogenedentota bacterium]
MAGLFADREIVLGVTGSIAAYKACDLASRLIEAGARVTPVLTRHALEFVGAVSFEAITGRRAIVEMFEPLHSPEIEHIAVAQRAELFLIAPATANILAKAAHGIADDWLSTTLLATRAPVLFAPAMNANMYAHPATQTNIETLRARGCHFVEPEEGRLACGVTGPGRLAETRAILDAAAVLLCRKKDLATCRVLITSGPNHEPIDPVRFIGNRSSGKMGRALALEALRRGARVTVISGPATVALPDGAETVRVETALEMFEAVKARIKIADVFISAAAVADYRVEHPAIAKRKRGAEPLALRLVPNPDIAAHVGAAKRPDQVAVGFAAETEDLLDHARNKLRDKRLDLIVANAVGGAACAIGADRVDAHLLAASGAVRDLPGVSKEALAEALFDEIAALLAARGTTKKRPGEQQRRKGSKTAKGGR